MIPLRRHKQYKNRQPEQTISLIQGILKEKLGLGLYERSFKERNGLFYSCRILLDNGTWFRSLNIGTNGKGMTEAYSRASAHGELMERIQNGVLLSFDKDTDIPYHYAFDEQVLSDDILLKDAINSFVFSCNNQRMYELNRGKSHYFVPYYSLKDRNVIEIPLDIIFNSISTNGLCVGNTPQEAIIEGLSEIMERYVIR
jgi:ribosomal protein S12 methylthiotransferase accessory factor